MLTQSRKISEDVDHGLNDLIKVLRNNPYKETFENLVEVKQNCLKIIQEMVQH